MRVRGGQRGADSWGAAGQSAPHAAPEPEPEPEPERVTPEFVGEPAPPLLYVAEPVADRPPLEDLLSSAERADDDPDWQLLAGPDADKQRAYLFAFSRIGTLTAGCRVARVSPNTVLKWREHDAQFLLLEQRASQKVSERVFEEALRRAIHGTTRREPVVTPDGRIVTYRLITEYSDRLLELILKARMPEQFRERLDVEHAGKGGGPIQVQRTVADLDALDDEQLDALLALAARRKAARDAENAGAPA